MLLSNHAGAKHYVQPEGVRHGEHKQLGCVLIKKRTSFLDCDLVKFSRVHSTRRGGAELRGVKEKDEWQKRGSKASSGGLQQLRSAPSPPYHDPPTSPNLAPLGFNRAEAVDRQAAAAAKGGLCCGFPHLPCPCLCWQEKKKLLLHH